MTLASRICLIGFLCFALSAQQDVLGDKSALVDGALTFVSAFLYVLMGAIIDFRHDREIKRLIESGQDDE